MVPRPGLIFQVREEERGQDLPPLCLAGNLHPVGSQNLSCLSVLTRNPGAPVTWTRSGHHEALPDPLIKESLELSPSFSCLCRPGLAQPSTTALSTEQLEGSFL